MADIDAAAHARVHVLNNGQNALWSGEEVFIFRTVVVDRDLDVVLFHEFLELGKRDVAGSADNDREPGALGEIKLVPDVGVVVFLEIDIAASVKDDAGGMELFDGSVDLLRSAIDVQLLLSGLDVHVVGAQLQRHADGLGARKIAERIGRYAQLDVGAADLEILRL